MKISKETRALVIIMSGLAILYSANYIWHSLRRTLNPDGFNRLACVELAIGDLSEEEAANRIGLYFTKPEKVESGNKISNRQRLSDFCGYYLR